MKRKLLIALLAFSFTGLFAQLEGGLKIGYNSSLTLSNMNTVVTGEYNNKFGDEFWNNLQAGVMLRIPLSKAIFLNPEVLYSISKNNYQVNYYDAATGDVTLDKFVNISTVDIPVLLGLKLINLKMANLHVLAGPKVRFNAGSSLEIQNLSENGFSKEQFMEDFKAATVGMEIGAGIDFMKFVFGFRYNLIDNIENSKLKDVKIDQVTANTLTVSLAWKLL